MEKAEAVKVGAELVEVGAKLVQWMKNYHPHLLVKAVQSRYPLLHGLYLLRPLLLISLVALIQLYVLPIGLIELPLC